MTHVYNDSDVQAFFADVAAEAQYKKQEIADSLFRDAIVKDMKCAGMWKDEMENYSYNRLFDIFLGSIDWEPDDF